MYRHFLFILFTLISINASSLGVYVKHNGELVKDKNIVVIGIDSNKVKKALRGTTTLVVKNDSSAIKKNEEIKSEDDTDKFFIKAWNEMLFFGGTLILALLTHIFSHFYVVIKRY